MEFYELNRLYNQNFESLEVSKKVVDFLFTFIPVLIVFGSVISSLGILITSRPYFKSSSKFYFNLQYKFNFLYQLTSILIFISNNYERYLIDNFYFKNNKTTYFKLKIYLNIAYNIFLYCLIWNHMFACLDYCFISIIKFHYNLNYSQWNRKLFYQQQVQFSYQQKLFHQQQSRLRQNKNIVGLTELLESTSNLSISQNNEIKDSPIPNKLEFSNFFSQNENCNYFSDVINEDSAIVESNYEERFKWKKKIPKSDQVTFFSKKVVKFSRSSIIILSILVAIPQFYGFNVRENMLAISPSTIPKNFVEENDFYFVRHDKQKLKNSTCNSGTFDSKRSYMLRNLALGFVLRTQLDKKTNDTISKMKNTHKNFFTQQGFLSLASMKYSYCNIVKKCKDFIVKSDIPKLVNPSLIKKQMDILNISLVCIGKSDWNEFLAYNTIYFWFEHTLVISAPICIVFVLIVSFIYLYAHNTKLLIQQEKIARKRTKMTKIQEQNSMAKFGTLNASIGSNRCETQLNCSDDFLNASLVSLKSHKTNKKLGLIQREDQNLNLMFIIDLAMYIFFALPYFFSRLILDLFSKHHEEINLDFYVYYYFVFILFQFCLVFKLLLMTIFDVKFRLSFARLFSIKPSTCLISDYNEEYYRKYPENNEYCHLFRCLCPFWCLNWKKSKQTENFNIHYDFNQDIDEYSTDFNSKLHQYNRPADPDIDT